MANMKIEDIEGIGPSYGEKLRACGITDTDGLLAKGKTPAGRKELCEGTELSNKLVLKWVNMADLFRIQGVGSEYAELLECSGVDTVKELGTRNAENLHAKMTEVNGEKNLTRRVPTADQVAGWVTEAKSMPAGIEY